MSIQENISSGESLLDELRKARSTVSVYKVEISTLASDLNKIIVVVEGKDDPGVYKVWLKQIFSSAAYRKFHFKKAGDKKSVFDLRDSTVNLPDFKNNILFIVDHDFDYDQGRGSHSNQLILDRYSIENYLYSSEMLDEILECSFFIEDESERARLCGKFNSDLRSLLDSIDDLSYLLYWTVKNKEKPFQMKKEKNDFSKHLIEEDKSIVLKKDIDIIDKMVNQISRERIELILKDNSLKENFDDLVPKEFFYRGKFIAGFFDKWIELILKDCNSENPQIVTEKSKDKVKFIPQNHDLSFYASKVIIPEIIKNFFNEKYNELQAS